MLRRVLGEVTFIQVVRDERDALMARICEQLDREADGYGISVVDVRIRRADLPEQNSQAVYQRMQTERQREAAEFRAQGGQKAQEIRSTADRQATVIIAEANSQAEQIRGEGDGERNRIFADAYNKDQDFFAFYRSMSAYETGLKANDTRFLLRPDLEFFRFFANSAGKPATAAAGAGQPLAGSAAHWGTPPGLDPGLLFSISMSLSATRWFALEEASATASPKSGYGCVNNCASADHRHAGPREQRMGESGAC